MSAAARGVWFVAIGDSLRSNAVAIAPLAEHVVSIVLLGSEPEMADIHTSSVVAGVEYAQVIRDRSIREFPSDTVGLRRPTIPMELAVSRSTQRGCPVPAIIWSGHLHLAPKPCVHRGLILPCRTDSLHLCGDSRGVVPTQSRSASTRSLVPDTQFGTVVSSVPCKSGGGYFMGLFV